MERGVRGSWKVRERPRGHVGVPRFAAGTGSVVRPACGLPGSRALARLGQSPPRNPGQPCPAHRDGSGRRRNPEHHRHCTTHRIFGGNHMNVPAPATAPAGAVQAPTTLPRNPHDRAAKRQRVLDILDARGHDALLLPPATPLQGQLDGSRMHISLAGDPVAALLVDRRGERLITFSHQAERLAAEELPPGVELHSVPSTDSSPTPSLVHSPDPASRWQRRPWPRNSGRRGSRCCRVRAPATPGCAPMPPAP